MNYKNKFDHIGPHLSSVTLRLKRLLGCLNFHLYRSKNLPSQSLSSLVRLYSKWPAIVQTALGAVQLQSCLSPNPVAESGPQKKHLK